MSIENLIKGEPDWHVKVNNNFSETSDKIGDLNGLTTTDKTSVVNAIKEIDASLLERAIFITPEMFGCVGDGVADDTTNLQTALNYAVQNNITIRSSKQKNYKISSMLNVFITDVTKGLLLDFENASIVVSSAMDYAIYFKMADIKVLNSQMKNLCIECNELSNGIKCEYSQIPLLEGLFIKNPLTYGVRVVSGAIYFYKSYISKSTFANTETTGIKIDDTASDSKIDMIGMRDIKFPVVDNGSGNFYNKIHPWLMTTSLLTGSIAFRMFRGGHLSSCNFDTFETALEQNSSSAIVLNNCTSYINTMFYNDATNTTQPTIFKYTNYMSDLYSLVISGCNFNFLSYYNTTGKKGNFSNANSTQLIGRTFIGLVNRNRLKNMNGIPSVAGDTYGAMTINSSYTATTNALINRDGFVTLKLVLDKSSDFSTTAIENLGNFPEGFYPDDISGYGFYKGYLRNSDVTDPMQFVEVDILVFANGGVRYLAIKIPSGKDVTNKRHLIVNLTLKSYFAD